MAPTHASTVIRLTNPAFVNENYVQEPQAKYDFAKDTLGEGGYGAVYLATDKKSKAVRAIKSIAKDAIPNANKFQAEIDLMQSLDHPNIIKLYESFEDKQKVYLAMELCEGGDMYDMITEHGCFIESDVACIMRQVLHAVWYMHKNGVVHRDLKPENVLFDSKGEISQTQIKIIDFGISCCWVKGDTLMSTKCGSPFYLAPEVLAGRYGNEVDVWSCGIIMYILFCGCPPFNGADDSSVLRAVKRAKVTYGEAEWARVSKSAKDMILKLLVADPSRRFTAEQALNHRFLQATHNGSNDIQLPDNCLVRNLQDLKQVAFDRLCSLVFLCC